MIPIEVIENTLESIQIDSYPEPAILIAIYNRVQNKNKPVKQWKSNHHSADTLMKKCIAYMKKNKLSQKKTLTLFISQPPFDFKQEENGLKDFSGTIFMGHPGRHSHKEIKKELANINFIDNPSFVKKLATLNETIFAKWIKPMPWLTAKFAMTLDGKIATHSGHSKWITSKSARNFSYQLRAKHDAVLIGERTCLLDNPSLIPRKIPKAHTPCRIVFNLGKLIPEYFHVWDEEAPTIFIISDSLSEKQKKLILKRGHRFLICPFAGSKINYEKLLMEFKTVFKIRSVFVEGGGHTLGDFYQHSLIDKVYVFIASKILGDGLNALSPFSIANVSPVPSMKLALSLKNTSVTSIGRDVLISGYTRQNK